MIAAALIRVSTPGQADHGTSLTSQERDVRAYCEQVGDTLSTLITDGAVSGYDVDRSSLEALDALVKARAVQKVIFPHFDRMSRTAWVGLRYLDEWAELGVQVVFLNRPHADAANPDERLMTTIEAGMAEREGHRIKERTMRGKRSKAEAGKIPGSFRAFGYDAIRKWQTHLPEFAGRDGQLTINPTEAETVRELFQRFAAGETLRELCRWLAERGIRTKLGNAWTASPLRNLLLNPLYLGELRWHQQRWVKLKHQKTASGKNRFARTARPASEQTCIAVPVILTRPDGTPDRELFQRVQARMTENPSRRSGRPSDSPLRGLVFCGKCLGKRGLPLRMVEYGTRLYCSSWSRTDLEFCGTRCSAADVRAELHTEALRATRPGEMVRRVKRALAQQGKQGGAARAKQKRTQAQLADVNAKIGRLLDLALEGFRPEELRAKLDALRAQQAALESDLAALATETQAEYSAELVAAQVAAAVADLRRRILGDDPEEQHAAYRELLRVKVLGEAEFDVVINETNFLPPGFQGTNTVR